MKSEEFRFHITSTPEGEAPLWVREAWVGLQLPLLCLEPISAKSFGVLSGPRSYLGVLVARLTGKLETHTGYAVPSMEAINLVGMRSPAAAAWWRTNTPGMLHQRSTFLFDTGCGRPVPKMGS